MTGVLPCPGGYAGRVNRFARIYRPRRRSNVRVGGCCLPIPLGVMTAGALGIRLAARRSRA
jgi:hypothetical protein